MTTAIPRPPAPAEAAPPTPLGLFGPGARKGWPTLVGVTRMEVPTATSHGRALIAAADVITDLPDHRSVPVKITVNLLEVPLEEQRSIARDWLARDGAWCDTITSPRDTARLRSAGTPQLIVLVRSEAAGEWAHETRSVPVFVPWSTEVRA